MEIKFLETKRNVAEVFLKGVTDALVLVNTKPGDAAKIAAESIIKNHPEWLDPTWYKDYLDSKLQATFANSPDKHNLMALRAELAKSESDYSAAKTAAENVKQSQKVDFGERLPELLNVLEACAYRARLEIAISKANDNAKDAKRAADEKVSAAGSQYTAKSNAMREALDTAGFTGYNLTETGQLVAIAAEKHVRTGNTSGKRGATTIVTCDGSVREFDSLVAAMRELGIEVPLRADGKEKGIGYGAGSARIVKALKAQGAQVVSVERK